ncbi:13755_t:CDS:1, partial [Ambispora leptoticha]
ATVFNSKNFTPITFPLKVPEDEIPKAHKSRMRTRPLDNESQQKANELFEGLIKDKYIEPSTSDWTSPLVIIKKQDGSYRIACDYTKLNLYIKDDPFEIPYINTFLQKIAQYKYYATIDFKAAYHQFPLPEKERDKTTVFFSQKGKYR